MAGSGTIRASPKPERVWALLAVVAGALTILVEVPAAHASTESYSFIRQAISDLGMTVCGAWEAYDPPLEVCSPAHPFVNGIWILSGSALAVIAFVWHDWFAPTGWGRTGSFLLAAGGIMQAGVGLVPADVDVLAQAIMSVSGTVAANFGLLCVGVAMIGGASARRLGPVKLGALTIGLGALGFAATLLMFAPSAWNLPVGLIERIAVYPFLLWFIIAGCLQLREASRRRNRRSSPESR